MKLHHFAALALIALTTTASADGLYGVGEVTYSSASLDNSYFDNALATSGATGLSSSDSGGSYQWRLQGGYRFNPYLALEVGYIDFGKADYQAAYSGGSAQGSLKAGGVDMAALLLLPLNDSFSIFGKLGVVDATVKANLQAGAPAASATGDTSVNSVRPLLGLGATYKLTDNVDLRADYDYVSALGSSSKTGTMDVNVFSMGAVYNF
jgi:OmpA-OmpF porin, OOP family